MSLAGLKIREGREQDLASVMALERDTPQAPHWAESVYAAMLAIDRKADATVKRCLLVAECDGSLVGFAVGKAIRAGGETVGELESLAVRSDAQRAGGGTALCRAVAAWCGREGASVVELEVREGSKGAIALYAGLGFVVAGRRRGYYQEPVEDALLMRLKLDKNN